MEKKTLYRKTPIMGWASWNCFRTNISEDVIKEQIDALISTGLAEYGYEYVNIDDGFFGGRDSSGRLQIHKTRFPNGIKVIADYAHKCGLKAGIYAEGGDKTCGYYYDAEGENGCDVGLYGHEKQDLEMYLDEFGFDFIKVDWCGGVRLGLDEREQYSKIGAIIDDIRRRTGRCIVYNICRWQFPGAWAAEIADSWRTGADITPDFESVLHQIDNIKPLAKYCSPGHVNDPDMMQLGNGMSFVEEKTHFIMWCMASAPLVIGCDLTKISPATLSILKNKELIAINQDKACIQAFVVKELRSDTGELLGEVWIKDLGCKNSPEKAVVLLNRSSSPLNISVSFEDAGLFGKILSQRDIWLHEELPVEKTISKTVGAHDTAVFRIKSEYAAEVKDINAVSDDIAPPSARMIDKADALRLAADGAYLVDVRTKEEYAAGHPDGAVNLPYSDIHAIAERFLPDKNKTVIVYCSTGKRSDQARSSLECLGYKDIRCMVWENL